MVDLDREVLTLKLPIKARSQRHKLAIAQDDDQPPLNSQLAVNLSQSLRFEHHLIFRNCIRSIATRMIAKPSPQQRSLPAYSVPFGLLNGRNVKKCQ